MFSVYLLAAFAVSEAQLAPESAGPLDLATVPLFLGSQVDPNVFFTLDDSGSMDWEVLILKETYHVDYWGVNKERDLRGEGDDNSDGRIGVITDRGNYKEDQRQRMAYIFSNGDNAQGSGRMRRPSWAVALQENPNWGDSDWRIRSAAMNAVYYNPVITYQPWSGFLDADYNAVLSNPQPGTVGSTQTRNLSNETFIYEVWTDNLGQDGVVNGPRSVGEFPNGKVDLWDSHTTYSVSRRPSIDIEELTTTFDGVRNASPGKSDRESRCTFNDTRTDPPYKNCFGTTASTSELSGVAVDDWGRTVDDVKQNIANWYQYHRRRSFVAKDAIEKVIFANTSFRFGLTVTSGHSQLFVQVPDDPQRTPT